MLDDIPRLTRSNYKTDNNNSPFKPINSLYSNKVNNHKSEFHVKKDSPEAESLSKIIDTDIDANIKSIIMKRKRKNSHYQYSIKSIMFENIEITSNEFDSFNLLFSQNEYPQGTFNLSIQAIKGNDFANCNLMDIKKVIYYCDSNNFVSIELVFFSSNTELKSIIKEFNCNHSLRINLDYKMTNELANQLNNVDSKIKSTLTHTLNGDSFERIITMKTNNKNTNSKNNKDNKNTDLKKNESISENESSDNFTLLIDNSERQEEKEEKEQEEYNQHHHHQQRVTSSNRKVFGDYADRITISPRIKRSSLFMKRKEEREEKEISSLDSQSSLAMTCLSSQSNINKDNNKNKNKTEEMIISKKRESPRKKEEKLFSLDPDNLLFVYDGGGCGDSSIAIHDSDYTRLNPSNYLNDVIIDWDLVRMWNESHLKDHIHIFNCFFHRKLRNMSGRDSWEMAKPWTNKINIFEKDILFIPICEHLHWYLMCVWKPGRLILNDNNNNDISNNGKNKDKEGIEIKGIGENDKDKNESITLIYCFDSLGRRRMSSCRKLECFLRGESLYRYSIDSSLKIIEYRFPKVPLQTNLYDCGCFLLQTAQEIILQKDQKKMTIDIFENIKYNIEEAMERRMLLRSLVESMKEQWTMTMTLLEKGKEEHNDNNSNNNDNSNNGDGDNKTSHNNNSNDNDNCIEVIEL